MKSRKFYGSVSRHANATLIFQHIKLQSSLPSQKVIFSNSLRRCVKHKWNTRASAQESGGTCAKWLWANGTLVRSSNPSSTPGTCWGPSTCFPSRQLHGFPAPADVLHLPSQSPFKEVLFFLATFLHSCDVGISYSHYSPVIFSPFSHTVLQTPETKITKGDFLGTLWHVCGFTDLKSGYS